MAKKAEIEALRNDDAFMSELLGRWYDDAASGKKGSANYCDLDYLGKNKIDDKPIDRDAFTSIRYDDKLKAKSGFLGLGGTTYTYDGVEIETKKEDGKVVLVGNAASGKSYQSIKENNDHYNKYVAAGMNNYISDEIHENITKTSEGKSSLAIYMVICCLSLSRWQRSEARRSRLCPTSRPNPCARRQTRLSIFAAVQAVRLRSLFTPSRLCSR